MIVADPREPIELVDLISARVNGQIRYSKQQLEAGDYITLGNGPGGRECSIAIEVKKLQDMLGSERSGRYVCQMAKMAEEYDFSILIIEGIYRPGDTGLIEVFQRGGWNILNLSTKDQRRSGTRNNDFRYYSELDNFETSLELRRNVIVKHSATRQHTAHLISGLYGYFQRPWDSHSSTEQVKIQSGILLRKASYLRMIAAQFPSIGWQRAGLVEKHFKSIARMINSGPEEWQEIDGIGKKTAVEVCRIIQEEYK